MRKSKLVVAFAIVVMVVLLGGRWLGYSQSQKGNLRQDLELFNRSLGKVLENYVEEPNSRELIESSIGGMLNSLDPNSELLDPDKYEKLMVQTKGEFGGLGILIAMRDEVLTVISPLKDTPAERIGIQAWDRIVKIEGESTEGITTEGAVKKLRGEPGTEVTITIQREGIEELIDYTITRDIIKIDNIPFHELLDGDIGYIVLSNFSRTAGQELREIVTELVEEGATKLIVDIRNNGGGLLDAAIGVTDNFLPAGKTIVSTKGRIPSSNREFESRKIPSAADCPLVILVNGGSASASEILSGAIQDWDRGLVMGDTTFGKGSVQRIFPLGNDYALKLTTAKYYTPSGRCIHKGKKLREESDSTFYTLGPLHREIVGGGGIIPDLVIEPRRLTDFETEILRKNTFLKFASQYLQSHPAPLKPITLELAVLDEFETLLAEQEILYTQEKFDESRDFILRKMKEEISLKLYGRDESYRIAIEHDPLIGKAKELLSGATSFEELFDMAAEL